MCTHAHHFVCSRDGSPPEAAPLWLVKACAGRLGAASLSPEGGAQASFEAARQEA